MSGLPLKLFTLFVRQMSRPLALGIKSRAMTHPQFKKFCISVAQRVHRLDVSLKRRLDLSSGIKTSKNTDLLAEHAVKHNAPTHIRPLNETRAIETGATFLSELVLYSVAAGIITFETVRARNKELNRRESVTDDIEMLQDEIEHLKDQLLEYQIKINDYVPPHGVKPIILQLNEDGTLRSNKFQQCSDANRDKCSELKTLISGALSDWEKLHDVNRTNRTGNEAHDNEKKM